MEEVGKLLIFIGLFFVALGVIFLLLGKLGSAIPLGRLPGDIVIKRDNFVLYFPLGTSLLLSVLLSLISFLFYLLMRKQ
jgi:hypothetical protein